MDPIPFDDMKTKLNLADLSKPALVGLAAIVIMVAVFVGRTLFETATATDFEITRASASAAELSDASQATESAAAARTIFVHVSGAVNAPGLYEIADGSRVAVAIEAAGGFSEDAVCDSVNLARVMTDGEMVVVASSTQAAGDAAEGQGGAASGSVAGAGATRASARVNINTASAGELETLPGIGAATAAKIVSDRQANGPFRTIEDLKRVSGIGDKKFEALADLICV